MDTLHEVFYCYFGFFCSWQRHLGDTISHQAGLLRIFDG